MVVGGQIIDDIRLCRRLKRDVAERGRTIEGVLMQYNRFVKSSYNDFIYPTIRYADLIVPGGRNNRVSIDFIVRHMKNMNRERYSQLNYLVSSIVEQSKQKYTFTGRCLKHF